MQWQLLPLPPHALPLREGGKGGAQGTETAETISIYCADSAETALLAAEAWDSGIRSYTSLLLRTCQLLLLPPDALPLPW